jgi:predicted transcriptional regulator
MDEASDWLDRSKSWIVRQAVTEWLAEEWQRRQLALDEIEVG